ncbi:bifunctional RNase H/acid phosphatase [Streptomyces longwoodensis]|uniref:bifunctional RNase H/acid phosphatase n=1 Tax=Streptomyces longwoodensis TaxID=68231 RepID=UPI002253B3D9|nr:bifunctional RNase H/acid phosphatase [Streptomyces longwoodensis]MCX4998575.1 bifunctional RNase H/acid phosphatase [Streptomyces longwoodensis]
MGEFIVEADGGSRGNPGPAGFGAVVIDAATGETLVERAEYLGVVTNNVAEYRGLLAGLRAAHDLDPAATVHVRMDSKLVVEQMSGRWKIKHPDMKPLAAEAARVFPPGRVTYEWIPREQNKAADRLANEAMDAGVSGETGYSARRESVGGGVAEAGGPVADGTAGTGAGVTAGTADAGVDVEAGTADAHAGTDTDTDADAAGGTARAHAATDADAAGGTAGAGTARASTNTAAGTGGAAVDVTAGTANAAGADVKAARSVAAPSAGWGAPDLGAPATFVLLRHGETPLTPQKRFSGSGGTDPALSAAGREQAERAGAALARRGTIQHIVSSPLARTRETAAIVAAHLGLDVTVEDGLRETDFGAWEGLTFAEVRERHPDDLNAWLADTEARPTGGGESFAETAVRIAAVRDELTAAHAGRTVLLVTHVTPIKTFVRLALGAPPESLFRMELSAASVSAIAYYADGNASVRLLNDTSHLRA